MKLQSQVCSLEQAKRLKELGIIQTSIACYLGTELTLFERGVYNWAEQNNIDALAAYTVAELGVMMPDLTYSQYLKGEGVWIWSDCGTFNEYPEDDFTRNTEAESRADAIIYLLELEHITPEEVNNRLLNS
jgi:hypothetical protein